jgi:hypothetical protein
MQTNHIENTKNISLSLTPPTHSHINNSIMFGHADRFGDDVAGDVRGAQESGEADFTEVLRTSGAEELVVCRLPVDTNQVDDDGNAIMVEVEVVLQATLDPESGALQWGTASDDDGDGDDGDGSQSIIRAAITRSQMTSMLRDAIRNNMYHKAIAAAIASFKAKHNGSKSPHVLDIGTGSGLLVCRAWSACAGRLIRCAHTCYAIAHIGGFACVTILHRPGNDGFTSRS